MATLDKKNWVLLALRKTPLDRIRLMKALFLMWIRSGRRIPGYFEFEPYLYGPCSFGLYSVLNELTRQRLVIQSSDAVQRWAKYYLTLRGKIAADRAATTASPDLLRTLEEAAQQVSQLSFNDLLRKVYAEAPEFAVNSLVREVLER